jgi:hypothetical protein
MVFATFTTGTRPVFTQRRIVGTLTLKMVAASVTGTRSGGDAARRASTLAVSSVKACSMAAMRTGISENAVMTAAMLVGSILGRGQTLQVRGR